MEPTSTRSTAPQRSSFAPPGILPRMWSARVPRRLLATSRSRTPSGSLHSAGSRGQGSPSRDSHTNASQGFRSPRSCSMVPGTSARYFGDYRNAMTALLAGKTMTGMRALDVVRGIDVLAARREVDPARITATGRASAALPVLYAALFDPRISSVATEGMLSSYDSVVSGRLSMGMFEQLVPSVLKHFDLPDVVAALAPRRVVLCGTVNPLGQKLRTDTMRQEYSRVSSAYQAAGVPNAFRIVERDEDDESFAAALREWLR